MGGISILEKEAALDERLREIGSLLVAFSGGVDSSYLAVRAHAVLGVQALAVTADSESLAELQRETVRRVVSLFGIRHEWVETRELENPLYARNFRDRCYYCKVELFRKLLPLAEARRLSHVAYGLLQEDLADFRPGHRAAKEAGVLSPLADVALTKDDVRALSKAAGLPTFDKPSSPCLSSRLPYGVPVTERALRVVERAEAAVRALGFREFRVRHFGREARLEIAAAEFYRLADGSLREHLEQVVQEAGYEACHIDPDGYRRGRLNEPSENLGSVVSLSRPDADASGLPGGNHVWHPGLPGVAPHPLDRGLHFRGEPHPGSRKRPRGGDQELQEGDEGRRPGGPEETIGKILIPEEAGAIPSLSDEPAGHQARPQSR